MTLCRLQKGINEFTKLISLQLTKSLYSHLEKIRFFRWTFFNLLEAAQIVQKEKLVQ